MVNLVRESNATNVVILIVRGGPLFSNYSYRAYLPEVKQQISDMAMNSSGIRDTAGVLRISPTTVIKMIKKKSSSEGHQ
jgi:pyruvate/oxaloacetate carboxyltransferase